MQSFCPFSFANVDLHYSCGVLRYSASDTFHGPTRFVSNPRTKEADPGEAILNY